MYPLFQQLSGYKMKVEEEWRKKHPRFNMATGCCDADLDCPNWNMVFLWLANQNIRHVVYFWMKERHN